MKISDISHLKELADGGNPNAQYEYGQICYQEAAKDLGDYEESFYYFSLAAEQGHVDACFCVGAAYYHGEGVEQSYTESVKYFRLAAEKNQVNALYNLGICYENGFGVEDDLKIALGYYRRAARLGYGQAKKAARDVKRLLRSLESVWFRIGRKLLWSLLFVFLGFAVRMVMLWLE